MNNNEQNKDKAIYAIINGENVKIDIPEEGALGLLAYGAVGLIAWRKVRLEAQKKKNILNSSKTNGNNDKTINK